MDHISLKLGFVAGWETQDSYHKTWEGNVWKEEGGETAAAMGEWGGDEGSSSSSCVSHQGPLSQQWQMNCNATGSKERVFESRNLPSLVIFFFFFKIRAEYLKNPYS